MLARRMPARVSSLTGNIVDVVGRRIFPGRVEWAGGRIVRIVPTPGKRYRQQIAPGFVDAHVHIESSLMPPSEFARWAVVHGTVATVSDPHEIANVLGEAGVRYMLDDARRSPLKFHFGAPSCVPATDRESSGATLDAKAVAKLLARRDVSGLSEVMMFIERERLFGLGYGLVDLSLLASTLMTPGARLWTLDKRLAALAERFGVAHSPVVH